MTFAQGFSVAQGLEITLSNFEELENRFYEVKYQDIIWRQSIPGASIDTTINPGANIASYQVTDWRGVGGFISDFGGDAPTVFFSRDKVPVNIQSAGVAAVYTLDDLAAYQFAYGRGMDTELMAIMAKATDRHVEGVFYYGQAELGFDPYLDLPGVNVANVPNGAAASPLWANKTADEQMKDVQEGIRYVWTNSRMLHLPDTVEIPPAQYSILNDTRIIQYSDQSALQWLKQHNLYTERTGKPLNILPNPHLEGAGVGGVNRMLFSEQKEENFKMPFPITSQLLEPQAVGLQIKIYNRYRFGGPHLRYIGSMAYRDGI